MTGTSSWMGMRMSADLSSLPHTLDASPSRFLPAVKTILGVALTGAALGVGQIADLGSLELAAFFWIFLLFGIGTFVSGLVKLARRRRVTFHKDGVEVAGRRLLKSESWYLPYTAYKGVLYREDAAKSERSMTKYQIIELVHEEPGKSVLLHVEPTDEVPRAQWEAYAQRLRLPALERDVSESSDMAARHRGDLDKPLKELAEDGTLGHAFDRDSPPPAGLRVTPDGANSFVVTIITPRVPIWFLGIFVLLALVGLAIVAVALFTDILPVMSVVLGLMFCFPSVYHLFSWRKISNREIRLDRRSLILDHGFPGRENRKALSFDQVESITIRRKTGYPNDELVIAGDEGRIHVGSGLSREALTWLKNFLTAAIAMA